MKTNRKLFAAAILGLALVAGCASTAKQESTGEYVDDTTLTTKVKAKFVDDKKVGSMNINVETFKGTVQLSGFADNQAEADRAVQIAKSTEGVKSVKNDIRLK
jgi:osmotically-inducible protein OsmY